MLVFSIVIGIVFGFFAALLAFVITYNEYEKHKFTGKQLFEKAFQSGVFTFFCFAVFVTSQRLSPGALHYQIN